MGMFFNFNFLVLFCLFLSCITIQLERRQEGDTGYGFTVAKGSHCSLWGRSSVGANCFCCWESSTAVAPDTNWNLPVEPCSLSFNTLDIEHCLCLTRGHLSPYDCISWLWSGRWRPCKNYIYSYNISLFSVVLRSLVYLLMLGLSLWFSSNSSLLPGSPLYCNPSCFFFLFTYLFL